MAGLLWAGLRAARGRYAAGPGARQGGAAGAVGDWLVLLGLLALLHTAAGSPVDPATAVVAVAPGLLVTAVATGVRTRPRAPSRVRRVLLVGEASGAERAAELLTSRTDHDYRLVAAIPVGPGPLELAGVQIPGRLGSCPADDDVTTVLGGVYAHAADLVLVAPGPQMTGDRLRRLGWGLHDGASPCRWSRSCPAWRPSGCVPSPRRG